MTTAKVSRCSAVFLTVALLAPSLVLAKRAAPAKVGPAAHQGVRYTAPNDDGRRAYDAKQEASGFGLRCLVGMPEPSILLPTMPDQHHHNVYVILLDSAVAKERKVRALNPQRDAKKPCVYVGMTGIPPIERFQNHKDGYKASYYPCKYGVRLLPELYEYLNPMPYEAACQMEKELAEDLREQGYTVCGGT